MTNIEPMLSYINMAIGIVGIITTVFATPTILGLGARIKTEELPSEMSGFGAGLRLFGVLLVLVVFVFLLALGIVLTLIPLSTDLGAAQPVLTSVLTVASMFSAAVSLALYLLRNSFFLPGVVGSIGLGILACTAGISRDGGTFFFMFGLLFVGFAISGIASLAGIPSKK